MHARVITNWNDEVEKLFVFKNKRVVGLSEQLLSRSAASLT